MMGIKITKTTFPIRGVSCSGCEAKIERILLRLEGVREAKASFSRNSVAVSYDGGIVGTDAMAAALQKAGYTLETGKTAVKPAAGATDDFLYVSE